MLPIPGEIRKRLTKAIATLGRARAGTAGDGKLEWSVIGQRPDRVRQLAANTPRPADRIAWLARGGSDEMWGGPRGWIQRIRQWR